MAQVNNPGGREIYAATLSGAQNRPFIPRLRSDSTPYHPLPKTLQEFRQAEGRAYRKRRLQELWKQLPKSGHHGLHREASAKTVGMADHVGLTPERAEALKTMYEDELLGHCGGHTSAAGSPPGQIGWTAFKQYAQAKEAGMRITFLQI
jgi:solute carrier family 25 phosphate transporter 23/24/25/41